MRKMGYRTRGSVRSAGPLGAYRRPYSVNTKSRALPFVHEDEARLSVSFDALIQRYGSTQAQEVA
jgi:hypothetical protein